MLGALAMMRPIQLPVLVSLPKPVSVFEQPSDMEQRQVALHRHAEPSPTLRL